MTSIFKNPFVDGDEGAEAGEDDSEPNTARGRSLDYICKNRDEIRVKNVIEDTHQFHGNASDSAKIAS